MDRNPWKRTKRQEMADGWASFCMLADPIAAWESVYSTKRVAVFEPELGGVSAIIAPFVYLADKGTAAALAAEIETLRAAAAVLRRRGPGPLHDPERLEETAKRVEAEIPRIERMQNAATMAEKLSRRLGYDFNQATRRMSLTGKGHRGRDLVRECARRIYAHQYSKKGNTASVRQKISRELSVIFESSELSPAAGALIFEAIRYHERSLKQIPCKR